ncbi:hypothetical protein Afil01_21280 [Actinorhabdospora filicis]|uniref:5-carboxymethyl-2-hydroxymuconate isomerase n=1 Tax=Actinorhabdospora filicis TaxID=1785913 RepID=A0A9W6SMJ1_9ACTN|nr:hypothetical protein [Actinorhabdospora filicis]GLZ77321.1 hypothetical protein Afil01_21280 [Actinorhabdospora filicis]
MPQIVVSYSADLEAHLDRAGFARKLHESASPMINAKLQDFKTRFLPIGEYVIGTGEESDRLLHVDFGLLDGRTEEIRERVGELVLELLRESLAEDAPPPVHITVEVREMHRGSFRKHITG